MSSVVSYQTQENTHGEFHFGDKASLARVSKSKEHLDFKMQFMIATGRQTAKITSNLE